MTELAGNFCIIDDLLERPYEGDPGNFAVNRVEKAAKELQNLVPINWPDANGAIFIPSLKISTASALLPSMRAVATDTAHNREVAQEVTQNLAKIGRVVCTTERLSLPALRERANVRGALSEFAVLSALWSMTANGMLHSDCYIWPTVSNEDRTERKQDGYKMGADLLLLRSQVPELQKWIQVKTRNSNKERRGYHPDTVHLSVAHLMEENEGKPLDLIDVVTKNDLPRLRRIGRQAQVRFSAARAKQLEDEAASIPAQQAS
ncbi:MAG TPA: hypothetical protein VF401_00505 [Candidatus Saccharimonadales bacterium]